MQRLTRVNQTLEKEIGILEVQSQIQNRAREEMSKTQRDYYLREQLRQIKQRARRRRRARRGDGGAARQGRRRRGCPRRRAVEAEKQVRRLDQMHAESAEAAVLRTYIEWLVELPWSVSSEDTIDLETARKILDEDHYDLEQIKDRILDYLAVRKLRGGRARADPVLPRAARRRQDLARALDRARARAQVRAHLAGRRARRGRDPRPPPHLRRRAAGAAHPGAQAGRHQQPRPAARRGGQAGRRQPRRSVGGAARGARPRAEPHLPRPLPRRALRSVEGGVHRHREPCRETIPPPLRDRMETLRLSGYAEEEKLAIAERYLVPQADHRGGPHRQRDRHQSRGPAPDRQPSTRARRGCASSSASSRSWRARSRGGWWRRAARARAGTGRRRAQPARSAPTIGAEEVPTFLGPPRYLPEERRRVAEIGTRQRPRVDALRRRGAARSRRRRWPARAR